MVLSRKCRHNTSKKSGHNTLSAVHERHHTALLFSPTLLCLFLYHSTKKSVLLFRNTKNQHATQRSKTLFQLHHMLKRHTFSQLMVLFGLFGMKLKWIVIQMRRQAEPLCVLYSWTSIHLLLRYRTNRFRDASMRHCISSHRIRMKDQSVCDIIVFVTDGRR